MTKVIYIRDRDEELWEELEEQARLKEISLSRMVNIIIKNYIKGVKNGNKSIEKED